MATCASPTPPSLESALREGRAAKACDRLAHIDGPYHREAIVSAIESDPGTRDLAELCRSIADANPTYNLAQIGREAGESLGRKPIHHKNVSALLGRPAPRSFDPQKPKAPTLPRSIMDDVPEPPPPKVRPKPAERPGPVAASPDADRDSLHSVEAMARWMGDGPDADPMTVETRAIAAIGSHVIPIRDALDSLDRDTRTRVRAWLADVMGRLD